MAEFDKHWDYGNPLATRATFVDLLPSLSDQADLHAQLQTQIARTHSLRGEFDEAHALLDAVAAQLTEATPCANIRYLLERGRTLRSSGDVAASIPLFHDAYEKAVATQEDNYAVDAAHMLAIVLPPAKQIEWNLKALALAEQSSERRANNWVGSLCNNLGWTYHGQGEYATALDYFERALAFFEAKDAPERVLIARWTIGRIYRSLNRLNEAIDIHKALLGERQALGLSTGYCHEELAECYLLQGKEEKAQHHFADAYRELSQDDWLVKQEPQRLARLQAHS